MEFLMGTTIWIYLFIFFGKITEVSISTLRIILINRGERLKGSILAFFEVSFWIIITSTVLLGIRDDIIKAVIYAIAFAIGNYIGSWLEGKLALGMSSIQVIVPEPIAYKLIVEKLRENNFGVTVLDGEGKKGNRKILILHLKRRRISQAIKIIREQSKDVFITTNNTKVICGGYITKK